MLAKKRNKRHLIRNCLIFLAITSSVVGSVYVYSINELSSQAVENQQKAQTSLHDALQAVIAAKEAKKKEPVYINLPGAETIRAIVQDYSLPDSLWVLVNKNNSLPTNYIPSPIKIPDVATRTDKSQDERSVRTDIEEPLKKMFAQAAKEGVSLIIGSGYRSAALQKIYFDNLAASVGTIVANTAIAFPGQSEHQTALAVDISASSMECYLSECFDSTTDGLWLSQNSYKYGFILRYPKDKESITGYQYEPWHFRYVGIDLATALYESQLTLEEAWDYIEAARQTLRDNGAI